MNTLRRIFADVDFRYSGSLAELSQQLSEHVFAGIPFVGESTGIWDAVPAVRLARRFLGLEVHLGGDNGRFGLSVDVFDFPRDLLIWGHRFENHMDIADYLVGLIQQIPGVVVLARDAMNDTEGLAS